MKKIIFKNIKFLDLSKNELLNLFYKNGLFVFPSGPGLSTIENDKIYLNSLIKSDYVFFDSGYFVLLLKYLKKIKVKKLSGYLFLYYFFKYLKKNNKHKILSIEPSEEILISNKIFLKKKIGLKKTNFYVAPLYNKNFYDKELINLINKFKPKYILINLGSGTQEILGYEIKKKIKYKVSIICTGAAISFFTRKQAPINNFLDKLYLGWFIRILFNPSIFIPRYLKAIKLFKIIYKSKITINKKISKHFIY